VIPVKTTSSNTGDDVSHQHEVETLGGCLERTTDHGEETSVEDAIDTSNAISSPSPTKQPKMRPR
jgi:hypothetical protein